MTKKVSMPYIGLPPFLLSTQKMAGGILSCQCPISGFPHFYCFFSWSKNSWICVSMPYIGLPPFLRWIQVENDEVINLCQCPISGFPHFYGTLSKTL